MHTLMEVDGIEHGVGWRCSWWVFQENYGQNEVW